MLPFFQTTNLRAKTMTEGAPWDFLPAEEVLATVRAMPKAKRREWIAQPGTVWNIYSSVGGVAPNLRVSAENPPACLRGIAADYDVQIPIAEVERYLSKTKAAYLPNFIEITHSQNIRLVWVFEREALIVNSKHCAAILESFFEFIGARTILPGFDEHSLAPAEVWTNGGAWLDFNEAPLPWAVVFGLLTDASKKLAPTGVEIPLAIIEEEIKLRFPGRWTGPFEPEATGVRFWDPAADSPTGCQVKPDGMLCFTGRTPFMDWGQIFGAAWAGKQRVLNLGTTAAGLLFDGRFYWRENAGQWQSIVREDILLTLRASEISTKIARGQTASDADRVLHHVQTVNRVAGAGPLVNYPRGLITIDDRRLLNTCSIVALPPSEKLDSGPADFPWTWEFIHGLFDHPELGALDHFLAWFQRAYRSFLNHKREMGQAVFLCGPKDNGKTLLCYHYLKPMLGNKCANPYAFFTGATNFNAELFEAYLVAINDEEAPINEAAQNKFLNRLKSWVVNPEHAFQKKFHDVLNMPHTGRMFSTLNDDPKSIGLLCEVNENTADKMCFFGSRPRPADKPFPGRDALEALIAAELPFFARWLLNWTPPSEVLSQDRMGVKSFFDPHVLELSIQQSPANGFAELVELWCQDGAYWHKPTVKEWCGSATDLVTQISNVDHLRPASRDWTVRLAARALTTLSRIPKTGFYLADDGSGKKTHRVVREEIFAQRKLAKT
jgi:hypothetical protein